MAQRKRYEETLPPLRVPQAIFDALKQRAEETRRPESEVRRMILEQALFGNNAAVGGEDGDGSEADHAD
jgi:hypothetical protein